MVAVVRPVLRAISARVAQYETDHSNGILFIDRMSKASKEELRPQLDELQANTKEELEAAERK